MNQIIVGKGDSQSALLGQFGNRHGLVAGATGTGKTVSLLMMAEGFSRMGTPVFMVDAKGDVAGIAMPGTPSPKLLDRVKQIGLEGFANDANPVVLWDLFGKSGHPVRATISEVGPTLLGRILELNDTQEGVLEIVFKVADDGGYLLLDIDDLRSLLTFVSEHQKEISAKYGLVSTASIAAIQRSLLTLDRDGGNHFFGEPALDLNDLLRTDLSGRGIINVLAADQLILKPRLYSSFMLWLVSELYENLPEVGDLEKPKLVVFIDEAHLLFDDAPPALLQRVEQVVRLIRSKGVGVYFCSQFPDDLPGPILGQMGNRVQHALRAFTPRDQKAVRVAAETFAANKNLDVAKVISELGVGEALVSMLQANGTPAPVQRAMMSPPRCRMGAITPEERQTVRSRSPVGGKYDTAVNRESAYELLAKRAGSAMTSTPSAETGGAPAPVGRAPAEQPGFMSKLGDILMGTSRRQGLIETVAKSTVRSATTQISGRIMRGVLGGASSAADAGDSVALRQRRPSHPSSAAHYNGHKSPKCPPFDLAILTFDGLRQACEAG